MTVEPTLTDRLSSRERARQAAVILATAIARLNLSNSREREIPLGFSPDQSVHATPSHTGGLQ